MNSIPPPPDDTPHQDELPSGRELSTDPDPPLTAWKPLGRPRANPLPGSQSPSALMRPLQGAAPPSLWYEGSRRADDLFRRTIKTLPPEAEESPPSYVPTEMEGPAITRPAAACPDCERLVENVRAWAEKPENAGEWPTYEDVSGYVSGGALAKERQRHRKTDCGHWAADLKPRDILHRIR